MNYYGDIVNGKTTITCPLCSSFNAKCNTGTLLTSEPPQYGFSCPDCNNHGYIFAHELTKYRPSATVASSDSTKALEDRIAKLEQTVETLRVSIVNMSQALIRY